jgi:hypothetical protein
MTIENMLRDDEHLRMIVRILINTYGVDVEKKVIGYDEEKQESIALDGRQVRLSKEAMIAATKNMALGLDWDEENEEVILFTGYFKEDIDGVRYDN